MTFKVLGEQIICYLFTLLSLFDTQKCTDHDLFVIIYGKAFKNKLIANLLEKGVIRERQDFRSRGLVSLEEGIQKRYLCLKKDYKRIGLVEALINIMSNFPDIK